MKRNRWTQARSLFLAAIAAVGMTGCVVGEKSNPTAVVGQPALENISPTMVDISSITARRYPRVDGSTSTYPLQFTIACHVLDVPCTWYEGDLLDATRRVVIAPGIETSPAVSDKLYGLYHNGTHGAYMNLIEYKADLILVARPPSEDELEAAGRGNIELEVLPIALDAFVFLKHQENPVDGLSLDQIRSIYTGELETWDEVGGTNEPIHTYQRNENSGSQELMLSLVMKDLTMIESPDMILQSMMGPISAISSDPLGIGYSVYFYAENIAPRDEIELLAVNGVLPDPGSIGDRSYPLTTEVYAVVRAGTPRHYGAGLLLEWLLTKEGQAAIASSGYVPIHR